MSIKLCIVGSHGTGKTTICRKITYNIANNLRKQLQQKNDFSAKKYVDNCSKYICIPEQFREIIKDLPNFSKQTEEITLATYGRQLYLENLYTAQGKNILCDRSLLDTFIYYTFFNKNYKTWKHIQHRDLTQTYSKIYLIEPSEREIENDNFRLTDKKEQLEIHKLFLTYFKDFENVVIVNQEKQDEIVEMIIEDLK